MGEQSPIRAAQIRYRGEAVPSETRSLLTAPSRQRRCLGNPNKTVRFTIERPNSFESFKVDERG